MAFTRRLLSGLTRRFSSGATPVAGGNGESRMGQPAPPIEGVDPSGRALSVQVSPGRIALVFLTSSCQPCQPFWTGSPPPGGVLITPGPATESRRRVGELARPGQVVVMSSEAWHAYGVRRSPWLVLVEDGTVVVDAPAPADWESLGP
jgi:hypothetical protein